MRFPFVLSLALFAAPLGAQAASTASDEQAVLAVVRRTFDAMRARDTTAFRSGFAPGARIVTTFTDRQGKPAMRTTEIDRFVAAIAGFEEEVVERIFEPRVQIVDNLATVWTEYDLHAGGQFSHCGVDAFHLGRTEDGWKIIHVTDTQRREGCPTRPPL
jgi:hypothetical protein